MLQHITFSGRIVKFNLWYMSFVLFKLFTNPYYNVTHRRMMDNLTVDIHLQNELIRFMSVSLQHMAIHLIKT